MLYCSSIFVNVPASKKQKMENIQQKALNIVNGKVNNYIQLLSVNHIRNKRCAIEVFKCLKVGVHRTAFSAREEIAIDVS